MRKLNLAGLVSAAPVLFVGPASGHMGATGVAKERMELMKSLGAAMKTLGGMARGEQPLEGARAAGASGTIVRHAPHVVSLFPANSGGGASEASPDIWRDPKGFRASADAMVAASEKLHAATTSNDLPAIRSAYRAVGETCKGCHKRFRVKKER